LRRPSSSLVRLSGQRLPSWWVAWFGARGAGRTAGSRRSPFFKATFFLALDKKNTQHSTNAIEMVASS
jgi:hypothetical protein